MQAFDQIQDPATIKKLRSRPRFHIRAIQNEEASEKQGHPVFRDVEYVEIIAPGNNQRHICRVQEQHRKMWPEHYKAFKDGNDSELINGFPIDEWPLMTRSAAETLKGVGILALEDLTSASDDNLKSLGPGYLNLKYKAVEFLKSESVAQTQIDKLQAANSDLMARLEKLEAESSEKLEAESSEKIEASKPTAKAKIKAK